MEHMVCWNARHAVTKSFGVLSPVSSFTQRVPYDKVAPAEAITGGENLALVNHSQLLVKHIFCLTRRLLTLASPRRRPDEKGKCTSTKRQRADMVDLARVARVQNQSGCASSLATRALEGL
jgi:hypothetical protein